MSPTADAHLVAVPVDARTPHMVFAPVDTRTPQMVFAPQDPVRCPDAVQQNYKVRPTSARKSAQPPKQGSARGRPHWPSGDDEKGW
jgi:hypothetical protein